jgi:hypothetical protein
METGEECTRELRKARTCILLVGIANFVIELFVLYVIWADRVDPTWRLQLTIIDASILAFFVVLAVLVRRWPVPSCVVALAGFWTGHIYLAIQQPSTLEQMFVLKVLYTIVLLKGIQSAVRAQRLQRAIQRVFG